MTQPETTVELHARICLNCCLVTVAEDGNWRHSAEALLNFADDACDEPLPGRKARPRDVWFGRAPLVKNDPYMDDTDSVEVTGWQQGDQPVLVGTDCSYRQRRDADRQPYGGPICWGYVATNGAYGFGATFMPRRIGGDPVSNGEMRAVFWAVRRLVPRHRVVLLTDSQDTVELIEEWRTGSTRMPRGYTVQRASERPAKLELLRRNVVKHFELITVRWVRGHTGHPLNEGADALAKFAGLWATKRVSKEAAKADARRTAAAVLQRFPG
ncbi:ribonuclease HI [Plantactinospora sp. BB1]|uniref:ribonuclease HI n=1 Tax=Plantactinospora sp. BB1 TaxID=2071627 RepID=UPI00131F236A|nr:RNase H family protein [Plantactinospora sp. BB1]